MTFSSSLGFETSSSPILKWYGSDWEAQYPNGGHLRWLADLVNDDTLKIQIEKAIDGSVETKFLSYNWDLNSQSETGARAGGNSSGDFGSGSIRYD